MHQSMPATFDALSPRTSGFGGIEFTVNTERYGITEEALAACFTDGDEIGDAMKVFKQHYREIAASAPRWARRRRGGLLMIFRDDVRHAAALRHRPTRAAEADVA